MLPWHRSRPGKADHKTRARLGRNSLRPTVEVLEDRSLPSAGLLNPAFGTGGKTLVDFGPGNPAVLATTVVHDHNTIVLGGTIFGGVFGLPIDFAVAELNQDGGLNARFGTGGETLIGFGSISFANLTNLAVLHDGTIVLGGTVGDLNTGRIEFAVAELTPDGALRSSFGTGGEMLIDFGPNTVANLTSFVVQDDGAIVLEGNVFNFATRQNSWAVTKLTRDGSLDSGFGTGGTTFVDFGANTTFFPVNLVVQHDGTIVIGGTVEDFSTFSEDLGVAELTPGGSLKSSFGNGGETLVSFGPNALPGLNNLVAEDDGTIVLGASVFFFTGQFDFAVAELTPAGSLNAGFGTGGETLVDFGANSQPFLNTMVVEHDGTIILGGLIGNALTGEADFGVVELTRDGSLNPGFGSGGKAFVDFGPNTDANLTSIVVRGDGTLVLAGTVFNFITGQSDFAVAELTRNGSLDSGFGTGGETTIDFGPQFLNPPNLIVLGDGTIVLGGSVFNSTTNQEDFAVVELSRK
jgi:uncharacterized delta-60 repeat protein